MKLAFICSLLLSSSVMAGGCAPPKKPPKPKPVPQVSVPVPYSAVYGDSTAITPTNGKSYALDAMTLYKHVNYGMRDVLDSSPVVILAYGSHHSREYSPEDFYTELKKEIVRYQRLGKKVVVETPSWHSERKYPGVNGSVIILADSVIRAAADTGAVLCNRYNAMASMGEASVNDGVHMSMAMRTKWRDALNKCVIEAMKVQ